MGATDGTLVDISTSEAVDFVKARHYTGSAAHGVIRYGWEISGVLVGVTIYDFGNHAMRQGVFGPENYPHVLHHHRLAISEGMPKGTASQFLGAAMRRIKREHPDVWAIVTYADECEGHKGIVYQATNATYTGVRAKGNLKFRRPDGVIVPTQSLKGTWPERRAAAARLGWAEIRCKGKHRYVYLLQPKRAPLLWPVVTPYPK